MVQHLQKIDRAERALYVGFAHVLAASFIVFLGGLIGDSTPLDRFYVLPLGLTFCFAVAFALCVLACVWSIGTTRRAFIVASVVIEFFYLLSLRSLEFIPYRGQLVSRWANIELTRTPLGISKLTSLCATDDTLFVRIYEGSSVRWTYFRGVWPSLISPSPDKRFFSPTIPACVAS